MVKRTLEAKPPEIIETSRLHLRIPRIEDAASIFETYATDPLVTRYLIWRPNSSVQETREFLERCVALWAEGFAFPWIVMRRDDQRLMGMIEARMDCHRVELGYVLARPFWGNGYMPEAARAIIEWALAQPSIYRVWAVCNIQNTASAKVLEKVGMQREGILRRWSMHPNVSEEPSDSYCYAITK
jgi:RimJ/RimL family protein N-acetyltransferase